MFHRVCLHNAHASIPPNFEGNGQILMLKSLLVICPNARVIRSDMYLIAVSVLFEVDTYIT